MSSSIDRLPLAERFVLQFKKGLPHECWEWIGAMSDGGYGFIKNNYRTRLAHRVAYELENGEIPEGLLVCHRCDNRKCVNPDHLFLGTHKDNSMDRDAKGRANTQKGEMHYAAKLSRQDVLEIRGSLLTQQALATKYGVSRSLVSLIKGGHRWGSI